MKKRLILLIYLCALLCVTTSCGRRNKPSTVPPEPDEPPQEQIAVPAVSEPPETPEPPSPPLPAQGEEPSIPKTGWSGMLASYQEILEELYQSYEDPEHFRYESGPSFALYDVDKDGVEELIVQDPVGEITGQWIRIYGYDDAAKAAYVELEEYSDCCYYDNGVMEVARSHNQCPSGDRLWSYTLYQYADSAVYQRIAVVEGWDKSVTDTYHGVSFPDSVDKDGDGFVYYVITEEGGYMPEYGEAMDNADYEAWRAQYLEGAFPVGPSFLPLVEEYISLL